MPQVRGPLTVDHIIQELQNTIQELQKCNKALKADKEAAGNLHIEHALLQESHEKYESELKELRDQLPW